MQYLYMNFNNGMYILDKNRLLSTSILLFCKFKNFIVYFQVFVLHFNASVLEL